MEAIRLLSVDLETTGRNPERDRIVEFAFIELDLDLTDLGRWSERVNPAVPIPPEATAFHGIRDEEVKDLPFFAKHAARIQKLVSGAILLAHNHNFDLPFLHYELVRSGQPGLPMDHPAIDTVTIERLVNSHKLGPTLARYTGNTPDGWHGAMEDAEMTVEVLKAQLKAHKDKLKPEPEHLTHQIIDKRIWEEIVKPSVRHPELLPSGDIKWLDRARKFYEGPDGIVRLAFGKHRDEPVHKHLDYLEWMLTSDFPADTTEVVRGLLESAGANE